MSSGWHRLVRFGLVGGLVALLDFAFIWILLHLVSRLVAVGMAYILAVMVHFALNRWWVFAVRQAPMAGQLWRYAVTVAACWLCTVGVTAAALGTVTANVFVAKAAAIPVATLLGFLLMRRFVFPPPPSAAG